MSGEVRVRGRDFVGYRIAGAIAALLLGLTLAWQVWELIDGDALTAPETHWSAAVSAGREADDASSVVAADIVAARTRLQAPRDESGPAPAEDVPAAALGEGEFLTATPMERDPLLTRAWMLPGEEVTPMLRTRDRVSGVSSLPYANADLFERPSARNWRAGMADVATYAGALTILGFAFVLAAVLALRGRVPIAEGPSGRSVRRFGFVERANHWMTAVSFIGLALTGSVLAFGDTLLRPFGEAFLGGVGSWALFGHLLFFPAFALGLLAMIVLWLGRNLPTRLDLEWLRTFGGFFSDDPDNPPARKFNAGQKLVFWAAVLGGLAMVVSGVALMFPFRWLDLDATAWVLLAHALLGALLIAVFIGHVYIGTVGMQGAFDAMWGGRVDRNWAAEHHELWLAEVEGRAPTGRG